MAKKLKSLSIEERKKLLDEAIDFFSALGKEREDMDYLLFKASAMSWVRKAFNYISEDVMWRELKTDKDIEEATYIMLQNMDFEQLIKIENISDSDAFWYYGWVGLAIGILKWNDKLIKDFKDVQKAQEDSWNLSTEINILNLNE